MKWKDKNAGKHPADPDYNVSYDPDEDMERYLQSLQEKEDHERDEHD